MILSSIGGNGTLAINLAADTASNAFGSVAATANSAVVNVIDPPPSVVISSALSSPTGVTPIPVTITFSEDVTGFDISDISGSVTNGNLSNFNAVSASVYSVDITPLADGAVTLQVPAASAQDIVLIPNDNTVSNLFSIDYQANDEDNDGVADGLDQCPLTQTGVAVDTNGCSAQQRLEIQCPEDGDYRDHGEFVSCVSQEVELLVGLGLITEEEGDQIISAAAQSDIGMPTGSGGSNGFLGSFELFPLMFLMILALAQRVRIHRKF